MSSNTTNSGRDWPEDLGHENGAYDCLCISCRHYFTGHKRRLRCKVCASQIIETSQLPVVRVETTGESAIGAENDINIVTEVLWAQLAGNHDRMNGDIGKQRFRKAAVAVLEALESEH